MNKKQVTEYDIRMPQFRDAKLEDLEFDSSGGVVRKDRFETSMRIISGMLHGVNGLSARSGWDCPQVIAAVKITIDELKKLKELTIALNLFPEDAEFYHPENKTYVKNIAQDALEVARKEHACSDLIDHETLKINGKNWEEDSAYLDYIDVLLSIDDIKKEIITIIDMESYL